MSGLTVISHIAGRQVKKLKAHFLGDHRGDAKRIDRQLPFNFRIGAPVELARSTFVLAGAELMMDYPGKNNYVVAYSTFQLAEFTLHRFYLMTNEEESSFVQVLCQQNGEVVESHLFREFDEIIPSEPAEWQEWLEGHIGAEIFSIFPGEGSEEGIDFGRVWHGDREGWVAPFTFREQVYFDPYGDKRLSINHQAMLYARDIVTRTQQEAAEFVLLSAEDSEKAGRIKIMTGIPVNQTAFTVF